MTDERKPLRSAIDDFDPAPHLAPTVPPEPSRLPPPPRVEVGETLERPASPAAANAAARATVEALAAMLGHAGAGGPPLSSEGMDIVRDDVMKGFTERFARLRPAQREYFRDVMAPWLEAKGQRAAVEALTDIDYEVRPPSPEKFLTDPDYVPAEVQKELFPAWRPIIAKVCNPKNGIFEVNITGGSSIGKTTAAMLIMDYKMVRTVCLKDAAAFYGLAARSMIYFGLYATTKKLIKDVGFYILRDQLIDPAPFWRDMFPRLKQGVEFMRWPRKRIEVITGSNELHALGRALFAVAADELNFYNMGEKTAERAPELVAELSRRLESRFIEKSGDIPGVAIYISQTRTTSDYLEQRMRDKKEAPGVLNVRGPRWAFNTKGYETPHPVGFRPGVDPTFRVYTGSDTTDPKILDKVVRQPDGTWFIEALDRDEPMPEGGRVIDVPVQHYRAFLDDIHGALRNIADVPSGSFTPFFPRREVIIDAFAIAVSEKEIIYPFSSQVIPCFERGTMQLQDCFEIKKLTRIHMGRPQPIRHPLSPRYIHLDLSQGGDRTGFVMVHHSGHYREDRSAAEDPAQVGSGEIIKRVEVDFYVALTAGPYGEPIDFRKVRVFIEWLKRCGYWIRMVTADQYMSFDMLQRLREMGFQADVQSCDRTSGPYRDLRQAMNEGRLAIPLPPGASLVDRAEGRGISDESLRRVILYQELMGLEHDVQRDKVDHRAQNPDGSKGSKDVADGLAGAVFRCLTDKTAPSDVPDAANARSAANARYNRYLPKATL